MKSVLRLTVILLVMLMMACALGEEENMTLHVMNVGKADAMLLRSGETTYLIDTGTEESWGAVSRALKINGVEHLDGVIITHTDKDHGGGAWALAQSSIRIDAWYASAYYTRKESKHPAINAAALRGQEVIWLEAGMTLPLDGGVLHVLGPVYEDPDKENNNSVVLLAEAAGGQMLLAGDMEFPEENHLLDQNLIPACNVLKVGNHGESDATSQAFLAAVQPEAAIISTNTNEEPDTPADRVMRALKNAGATVYQTQDSDAGVVAIMQSGTLSVANMRYTAVPEKATGVIIREKGNDDSVTVRNEGSKDADLTDWFIYSERGGQTFVFPAGTILRAGEEIRVVSESSDDEGDLTWPDEKVWHKNKDDAAYLYDSYGQEIAMLP